MRASISALSAILAMNSMSLGACAGRPAAQATAHQLVIEIGDLDPQSQQGATLLLARIESAARKACGGRPTFSSYTGALDNTFAQCRDTAIRQAISQLNAPLVARAYQESGPAQSRR